jgi:hypothetical protein
MRDYYNRRIGKDGESPELTLGEVAAQLAAGYDFLDQQGYLQKSFGYHCVDAGDVAGDHGIDLRTHFYLDTGIRIGGSVRDFLASGDEVAMFTLVEFLHDHTARPDESSGRYHSFSGCGWHFDRLNARFDVTAARQEWREKVNRFLKFYGDGYELSGEGEVVRIVPDGFGDLVKAGAPAGTSGTNIAKLNNAVRTFRLGLSTREQRKQALRELADLLEFYRPQVKNHFRKEDEADLFNIANNYAIRHHNQIQKDEYDEPWLTWIFYNYLATVRLLLELVHGPLEPLPAPTPAAVADDPGDDIPF